MHLLIDGQPLQTSSRSRGIGRYSGNLIAGLRAVRPGWHLEVVQSSHLAPADLSALDGCAAVAFDPPFFNDSDHAPANERYYADWLSDRGADAILVLNFFEGDAWIPRFTGARPPLYGILYDLIPLVFPRQYLGRSLADHTIYAARLRQMMAADGMMAISEASARDFQRLLPEPRPSVASIGGAADPSFGPHAPADLSAYRRRLRQRFGLRRDFVLYVGGPDFRKNLHGTLEAFAALPLERRRDLDLVVCCFLLPDQYRELQRRGQELGIEGNLKLTGYVTDEELRALYQLCRVFFFPSLYEGLGLPVLEAMMCGAPVVAADASSIPEFTGPASWLANPASKDDLTRALGEALAEPRDRRQAERVAHARGYTWEDSAEAACGMLTSPVRPAPARKPRLAWVAPLPPAPCALAYYASELLELLADRYEIEVVVAPNQPALEPDVARRHPLVRTEEVAGRHEAEPYDLFVYHLGNTPLCRYGLDLLPRFPGLLMLHDYPSEGNPATGFGPRIFRWAEGLLVNSAWAYRRARQETDAPTAWAPLPVCVPSLPGRAELRRCLGIKADAFVVALPGTEATPASLAAVLSAIHELPEAVRGRTKLLVLGPLTAALQYELSRRAAENGLAKAIIGTPALSLGEMASHARAADVWLHGDYPHGDEPAGHLFRAMAAGTPCIVADGDGLAELPPQAVWKVTAGAAADLATALRILADDPALRQRMGAAGAAFARRRNAAQIPARCAALIDATIQRRQARDAGWVHAATQALGDCADSAAALSLIDQWAVLRARGQERLRERRTTFPRVEATMLPPAAAELLRA